MSGPGTDNLLCLGPLACADGIAGGSASGTADERSTADEWLLTDGLGGYAMGTASGLRTRRYHGLLVVSTHDGHPADPADGVSERHLALASLDAILVLGGRQIRLGTHEWAGGVVDPMGANLLCSMQIRPGSVVHRWAFEDVVVEREIAMTYGRPATGVVHRVVRAPGPVRLELSALGTWRDAHGNRWATGGDPQMYAVNGGAVLDGQWRISGPGFVPDGRWYRGVRYREEAARGLTDTEDLWHIGTFAAELGPGQQLDVVAWAADAAGLSVPPPDAGVLVSAAHERATRLLQQAGVTTTGVQTGADTTVRTLVLAADQFITTGPGVVAGYPWFGEWSRDTMTSYEGLFLVTGRHDEGSALLRRYAATVSQGMLANTADTGQRQFNTVDATPWFLHAVRRHVDVTQDLALGSELVSILLDIVDAHVAGTRYGIRVDPADGLLTCAAAGGATDPGIALTWMDARVDGLAVTPRHGKPVEVNALWINGLRGLQLLIGQLAQPGPHQTAVASTAGDQVDRLLAMAQASFITRFVDGDGSRTGCPGGLLDVVDAPDPQSPTGRRDDASLRPNQLLAASLPYGPLAGDAAASARVVRAVAPLVTPIGLRSLAATDPRYRGLHRGDPVQRDEAYHMGTVWPWLIGPYAGALRAVGLPLDGVLDGLRGHLVEAGLASVSETADGDAPHRPTGCPMQAWSVAELLRVLTT